MLPLERKIWAMRRERSERRKERAEEQPQLEVRKGRVRETSLSSEQMV
jgi:hypothetical protein